MRGTYRDHLQNGITAYHGLSWRCARDRCSSQKRDPFMTLASQLVSAAAGLQTITAEAQAMFMALPAAADPPPSLLLHDTAEKRCACPSKTGRRA